MWPKLPTLRKTQALPIGLHLTAGAATLVQFRSRNERLELQALASAALHADETASHDDQDQELAAALRRLVAEQGFRGRHAISCLGAQHLFVQNLRLPVLPPGEAERHVRMEIEERLPYSANDAEIRHLIAGEVRQDGDIRNEIVLLACHKEVLRRHIQVLELAGLAPLSVDIEPLALLRVLVRPDQQSARRGYLLFGERSTAVIMAEGQRLLFLKYIGTGTQHFDQAVARHLVLSPMVASQTRALVTTAGAIDPHNDVHRAVMDAIRGPMDALCAEIELCLRYFKVTFRGQGLDSLVLAGADATGWMADYIQRRLGLPALVGDPFGPWTAPPESARDRPGRWAVAAGLSLKRWADAPPSEETTPS